MDAARVEQLAAMDVTALVAELCALSNAGSRYDDQAWCCFHLFKASPLPTGATLEDAVRAVVAALTRGVQHAALQTHGCDALALLLRAASAASVTSGADGVAAVLAAMRAHPDDAEVQSAACHALIELGTLDATNCATAGATGGVAAVVAAMTRHSTDPFVVQRACNALGNLARHHRQNAVTAVKSGAVTASLAAMRDFSTDMQVQLDGCYALCHIFDKAGTLGGAHADGAATDATVAAMRAFASDHVLQRCCCDVLGRMFLEDRSADAAWVRRGGVVLAVVTAALGAHRQDVDMLTAGCVVIKCLMMNYNIQENQCAAGIRGTVEAIVAAMRAFPMAAMLQVHGCDALVNICYTVRDNQLAAAATGGLEVAIAAMRAHASNVKVQYAGCCVLGALATDIPRIQRRVGELGGVEVVAALSTCAVEPPPWDRTDFFQRWGQMMRTLMRHQPINAHTAVAAGVIELIVAHMCVPDADTDVFEWACIVLHCLVVGTGHEARAVVAGALEALETRRAEASNAEAERVELIRYLQSAKQRHDAAPCAVAGCQRCAAARASGAMCALPGCGSRCRDGAAKKKLLRCGTCRAACYCGPAHQRADWGRHKGACGAPPCDDGQADGVSGS
jgi:hypothetical protein